MSPIRTEDETGIAFATVHELKEKLNRRTVSSVELTELSLKRLETIGTRHNAVATLMRSSALEEARRADADLAAGKNRGPLHGIPYGAKDLLDTKGVRTTWGSGLYRDRIPEGDATVVNRLREAGAVLVAKLSMVELAGGAGYRFASASLQGPGRNPWNRERWTGGSSSGSGAAVAAGLVPFAIGSETWGSIVCPSSYCGISGLRPSFGSISRHGAMALCWTLDKLGPLARSAEDLGVVFSAMAGADPRDASTMLAAERIEPVPDSLEIGILPENSWAGYQPEAVALFQSAMKLLESGGHRLVDVKLPDHPFDALLSTILSSEASAAFEPLVRSGRHLELIDPVSRTGLLPGMTIPAVDYINAMRRRKLASRDMSTLFDTVDLIAGPSFPSVASPIDVPLDSWYALPTDPLGAPGNLCGLPVVSVPCGFGEAGLPLGVSFMGPAGGAAVCLSAAKAFQGKTDFHLRRPRV